MIDRLMDTVKSLWSAPATQIKKTPRVYRAGEHGIDPALVSREARRTCEALQSRGFKAYIVGGAVRDLLLGVTPKDFDVATDATPEQVKRAQRHAVIIGRRFRLVHVIFGHEIIECSTFRALNGKNVMKDASGRVLADNEFGEMWEDAARRDFTVNALYYDPSSGELFDYHDGFADIAAKKLRMIGDPEERYREDPVRMMRAVRIAAKLGFTIEAATERAIPKMSSLLANVPHARLCDEVLKILTSGHALACVNKLAEVKLERALDPVLGNFMRDPDDRAFLLHALERTDARIASGKKTSPFFLYGTILWPIVERSWADFEKSFGMKRPRALHCAAEDVLETHAGSLSIQRRRWAEIYELWTFQARLERRTGKFAYALIKHPRYRAAWDFLLLRAQAGRASMELVKWWEEFAAADEYRQAEMLEETEAQARQTADLARQGREAAAAECETEPEAKRKPRRRRSNRRRTRNAGER